MDIQEWTKKRWFELRIGHQNYWGFVLSMLNFALIVYGFVIEKWGFNIGQVEFIVILIIIYTPLSVVTGHFHNKLQMGTDQNEIFKTVPQIQEMLDRLEEIQKTINNKNLDNPQ